MRTIPAFLLALLLSTATSALAQRIEVTIPTQTTPHGHLILVFARDNNPEPRFQLTENYHSAQGFGVDVPNLAPGQPIVLDAKTFANPLPSLSDIEPGDYYIQAVFSVYEAFHPTSSDKTLWLPPDRGEGQHWFVKPSNPYSKPEKIHFDPKSSQTLHITLDQTIPPIAGTKSDPEVIAAQPSTSKWLRYMRFRSPALSKFWGRDVYLGAWILLPQGYDQHPNAHYPLIVFQDHYHPGIGPLPFVASPPSSRSHNARQQAGYKFFQDWTSAHFPRVLLLYIQDPNPYYDDSYAVDSANVGPYGTAINHELIPVIEKKYRGIGQGWARATFGGSTGGWRAFATQVFYPDMYNGAYVACPDPVDFDAFQDIDLYNDTNAFYRTGPFTTIPMAGDRLPNGSIIADMRGEFGFEHVLGTHGRSTENIAMWQAVFSPVGPDGYPAQFVNPLTGDINKKVIAYWNQHYDLTAILKRDWPTLGPKLQGKLHFAVGDGDTYFLNNAVHLLQNQLEKTTNPHSDATFQYGPGMPHCYTGGPPDKTMQQNNLTWPQRVIPQMTQHMIKTAPAGADVTSWQY